MGTELIVLALPARQRQDIHDHPGARVPNDRQVPDDPALIAPGQRRELGDQFGRKRRQPLLESWRQLPLAPELLFKPRRQVSTALGQPGRQAAARAAVILDNNRSVLGQEAPHFLAALILAFPLALT